MPDAILDGRTIGAEFQAILELIAGVLRASTESTDHDLFSRGIVPHES
jgi:hypothetical protein